MRPVTWPCPLPGGGEAPAMALAFDQTREHRLLIVPALFDEANRMRRQTVEVMRRLDAAGIDCFLPDLPGCNESPVPLEQQTVASWRMAVAEAAALFDPSHVLGVRGGALLLPDGARGWRYAPVKGATILRQMLRARILSSREAGVEESQESLMATGLLQGLELAGYRIGGAFLKEFQSLVPAVSTQISDIDQDMVSGSGLWLRAEPDEDRVQADALAAILAIGIKA